MYRNSSNKEQEYRPEQRGHEYKEELSYTVELRGTEFIPEELYNRKVQKYARTAIEWQETEHILGSED